jgi:quinol monooxygenase YgiN
MSQMVLMTEYRTRPGKRNELFALFDRLLAEDAVPGRGFIVWSTSEIDRDSSYLFEYWNDADDFAELTTTPQFAEYVAGVDRLVSAEPVTTVTVPRLLRGAGLGPIEHLE